jgi:hypothetical protein
MVDEPAKSRFVSDGKVEFHYQKTSQYRGIHADGFCGGPTPAGSFAVSFFSERQPIPRRAQRPVLSGEEGTYELGPEEMVEVLPGVVRQVEATVYMDLKSVQELYSWLGPQVAAMEKRFKVPDDERVTKDGA